jgi:DNA-binding NarL/FixJ family response regulator
MLDEADPAPDELSPPMSTGETGAGTKPRVLIVADHLATRVGMRLALNGDADCAEAGSAEEAVAAALREQPDVCVIDLDPAAQGIRAAARLTETVPGISVIVLTRRVDADEFIAAMRAGAVGYLPAGFDPARLPHVVNGVLRGEAAVPRVMVARLVSELRGRDGRRRRLTLRGLKSADLTAREWEVLELVRRGDSTRAIAERLGISAVTVRRHASSGNQKLGVRNREELMRLLQGTDSSPG